MRIAYPARMSRVLAVPSTRDSHLYVVLLHLIVSEPRAKLLNRIKFRLPVVIRRSPSSRNPAALHQPHQRRVNRPLIDLQSLVANLLNPPRNPITMQRPHPRQSLQHPQIQSPLQNLRPAPTHTTLLWHANRSMPHSCGMSTYGVRRSSQFMECGGLAAAFEDETPSS